MDCTRRSLLAALGAGPMLLRATSRPSVSLYSRVLAGVAIEDLGDFVRELGFDGCALSVEPNGHVPPQRAPTDLLAALSSLAGAGLAVPMVVTSLTRSLDASRRSIAYLANMVRVPYLIPGFWPSEEVRSPEGRREITSFAAHCRSFSMTLLVRNARPGTGATWRELGEALDGIPLAGWYFDPAAVSLADGNPKSALEAVLPRLRALVVSDLSRAGEPCPLGEGVVDWKALFARLFAAGFSGPVVLEVNYHPKDEPAAARRDLTFLRACLAAAYVS